MKIRNLKTANTFAMIFLAIMILTNCNCNNDHKYSNVALEANVIPKPMQLQQKKGAFLLHEKTGLYVNQQGPKILSTAAFLKNVISRASGYNLEVKTNETVKEDGIYLIINEDLKDLGPEGYSLRVDYKKIVLEAFAFGGLMNGIQTIRQLLPDEIESSNVVTNVEWTIPCVDILDKPRFSWRGYMKDVSRTFYKPDVIKKYLDVLALYKMNVFHLHLTDDQGWRIEIKKYPKLTSKQATVFHEKYVEPAERSGFYTQEQLRDLVKYAEERNITIVPEIDLPGHSWPALLAYPELSVNKNTDPPHVFPFLSSWSNWPNQRTPNTFDPTNEKVYAFLNDVFDEIVEIFPSEYIHFGGDEVQFSVWEKAPHVQQYIKTNGLKDNHGLQNYFVARLCDIIKSKGRKPIGWNDILEGDPERIRGTAIMAWLGIDAIKKAAENKFFTVATPTGYTYFDITQANRNDGTMSDLAYQNINSMERIYGYEPTEGLTSEMEKYVLGIQANMWTAIPQEVKDVNVQNFPRLLAIAEIGWLEKGNRNYNDFLKRLEAHYRRLDEMKIDYYRKNGYIAGTWTPEKIKTEYDVLEWNVTEKVYTNGRIVAGFYFTGGNDFLEINKVELLENTNVISIDEHYGLANDFRGTHKTKTFLYYLKIDNYNIKSKYIIRALARGKNSTDSYGNFTFNLSPYKPFSIIETDKERQKSR